MPDFCAAVIMAGVGGVGKGGVKVAIREFHFWTNCDIGPINRER